MTTTTTTHPAVGTRVRITAWQGGAAEVGALGTVTEHSTEGRYVSVAIDGASPATGCYGNGVHSVGIDGFEVIEESKSETHLVTPDVASLDTETIYVLHEPTRYGGIPASNYYDWMVSGVRVRLTRAVHDCDGEVFCEVVDDPSKSSYVMPSSLRVEVAGGDLSAEQRAEKAEADLQAFKDLVRSKVIEEAREQGWCDRTDGWLIELGLPTRYADLPQGRYAVVLLEDGTVATRSGTDSRPWAIYDAERDLTRHRGFAEIASIGIKKVVSEGNVEDPYDF
jgi:hypothetical protein